MTISKFANILLSMIIIFYILIIGKSLLLPLVIAIVMWYVILAFSSYFEKIKIGTKNVPHFLALILSFFVLGLVLWVIVSILQFNIGKMIVKAPEYQEKVYLLLSSSLAWFGVSEIPSISNIIETLSFSSLLGFMTDLFTNLAGYAGMALIYLVLIFLEYKIFNKKIEKFLNNSEKYFKFCEVIKKIDADIKTYVSIKTGMSLLTAILSYIILMVVGIDFPLFWAMLIFVLNYIPTIGSIIAVTFPLILSLVQFPTFTPFVVLLILLILVQVAVGNIIEPKLMGKSLNLSPLVIILSLGLWGAIWGVVGMFLSIPIMVIVNIILAKLPKTRGLAIMFSANGKV
ncbi:MAG: AI-2E family transporter [Patescibacteria group bacterium]|jgi:AI-2 transport protein TqsA|nr:AI-2E family transporter [Patescibacteria group bacterium]